MQRWLLLTAVLGGAFLLARRRLARRRGPVGIDNAGAPVSFEQRWSPAEHRADVSVAELQAEGWAALIQTAIRDRYPFLSDADFRRTGGNLELLAGLIAERTDRALTEVHQELLTLASEAQPTEPSWPSR
ncbi:MAG TPA: hypothetical protein VIO14_00205 [Dehalococcoidia bacterium]